MEKVDLEAFKKGLENRKPRTLKDPELLGKLREIFAERVENFLRTAEAREEYKLAEIAQQIRDGEKIPVGGWWEDCLSGALNEIRLLDLDELDYAKSIFFLPTKDENKK